MELNDLLKEAFNAQPASITDETRLMSFEEWDSMNHMLFITKLEEAYGIELTGDEIAMMQTVGDVKKVLEQKAK
ncbi:MAG: acyl carrier protein [Opitutaceae bacterium]|nr:acyl carrier protein [Cytophagales bacterium]